MLLFKLICLTFTLTGINDNFFGRMSDSEPFEFCSKVPKAPPEFFSILSPLGLDDFEAAENTKAEFPVEGNSPLTGLLVGSCELLFVALRPTPDGVNATFGGVTS